MSNEPSSSLPWITAGWSGYVTVAGNILSSVPNTAAKVVSVTFQVVNGAIIGAVDYAGDPTADQVTALSKVVFGIFTGIGLGIGDSGYTILNLCCGTPVHGRNNRGVQHSAQDCKNTLPEIPSQKTLL